MAQRHRKVRAELSGQDVARAQLMVARSRAEGSRYGNCSASRSRGFSRETPDGIGVQRCNLRAGVLVAALDDRRGADHDVPDVSRPRCARTHAQRRGGRQAQHTHGVEPLTLDDCVGRVGRAEHRLGDQRLVHVREQLVDRLPDALNGFGSGGDFDRPDDIACAVDDDCVGVGAPDVDADAELVTRAHAGSSTKSMS